MIEQLLNNLPYWLQIAISAVVVLCGPFVVPFLKQKAAAAKSANETESYQRYRDLVKDVRGYIDESVERVNNRYLPQLAQEILDDELGVEEIRDRLYSWGDGLRDEVFTAFDAMGVNLSSVVDDETMDEWIRTAVDKLSPFGGQNTAQKLANKDAATKIRDGGPKEIRGDK